MAFTTLFTHTSTFQNSRGTACSCYLKYMSLAKMSAENWHDFKSFVMLSDRLLDK